MSNQPKMNEFCWNELATTNVKAAKDFYGKVFGWVFSDHEMDGMTYTMVKSNGQEFAGIWAIPKGQEKEIPPHWMSYILVEDVEAALEKAKKHGATIIRPLTNAGDFGRLGIIADPTGAHIALWQPLRK